MLESLSKEAESIENQLKALLKTELTTSPAAKIAIEAFSDEFRINCKYRRMAREIIEIFSMFDPPVHSITELRKRIADLQGQKELKLKSLFLVAVFVSRISTSSIARLRAKIEVYKKGLE